MGTQNVTSIHVGEEMVLAPRKCEHPQSSCEYSADAMIRKQVPGNLCEYGREALETTLLHLPFQRRPLGSTVSPSEMPGWSRASRSALYFRLSLSR